MERDAMDTRLCNLHVDAFCVGAGKAFSGNPAAVVILPADNAADEFVPIDDAYPPLAWMQALAAENALSETAYLQPRTDGSYYIRWCTPGTEVDLCGHATLAAAHALWDQGHVKGDSILLQSRSGMLRARRISSSPGTGATLIELDFPAEPPTHVSAEEARKILALLPACFSVDPSRLQPCGELALTLGQRPGGTYVVASKEGDGKTQGEGEGEGEGVGQPVGVSFIGRNRHDVYVEVDAGTFKLLPKVPNMHTIGSIRCRGVVITSVGPNEVLGQVEGEAVGEGAQAQAEVEQEAQQPHFISRWFGPQVGVPEDPVTGSAHCGLTAYWTGKLLAKAGGMVVGAPNPWLYAHQASARGGDLQVRLVQDEQGGPDRVLLRGYAVTVVTAWLTAAAMPPGPTFRA